MVAKRAALGGAGVGLMLAGGFAGRRLLKQWAKNPDPLNGVPVRFPAGTVQTVELSDGARIHTEALGTGPTIVLVHGLTAMRHDWGPIAPLLVDAGFRVLVLDQRGHGESTVGTAGFGSSQLANDLADVFEQLDVRAACLVGHSMGGMTAMTYATRHPEAFASRVDTLALVATASELTTLRHRLGLPLGGFTVPDAVMPEGEAMRLGAGLGVFGKHPSLHMVDEAIWSFRQCDEDVRTDATVALRDHDVTDLLHLIDVPTVVIGAGRDQLIRPSQVRALHAGINDSTLATFPDAGHMVHWERHRQVARLILDLAKSRQLVQV